MQRIAIAAVFLAPLTTTALADQQDLCSVVITQRAFNVSDNRSISQLYNHVRKEMCNQQWSDSSSFNSTANNLGIDIGISYVTFGLTSEAASSSANVASKRSLFCSMDDEKFVSYFAQSAISIDPGPALAAWTKCIDSQSEGFWSQVSEDVNFSYFDITLIHKTKGRGDYDIQSLNAADNVTCKDGSEILNPSTTNPKHIPTGQWTFRCSKPSETATSVSVNTTSGSAGPIDATGTALTQEDLKKMQSAIGDLQSQVVTLSSQLAAAQGNISAIMAAMAKWKGGILAAGIIQHGALIYISNGASYNGGNGNVSFPNPDNIAFAPVISGISANGVYQTESCYARNIGQNNFTLWQGAQDTGGRNELPRDCTFVVVGAAR